MKSCCPADDDRVRINGYITDGKLSNRNKSTQLLSSARTVLNIINYKFSLLETILTDQTESTQHKIEVNKY